MATHSCDLLSPGDPVRSELWDHSHVAPALHILPVPSPTRSARCADARGWFLCPSFKPVASDQPTGLLPNGRCEHLCDESCSSCEPSTYGSRSLATGLPTGSVLAPDRHRSCEFHQFACGEYYSQHKWPFQRCLLWKSNWCIASNTANQWTSPVPRGCLPIEPYTTECSGCDLRDTDGSGDLFTGSTRLGSDRGNSGQRNGSDI
jgi:hypothetical protein